ncbi:MAG: DNA polymerase/3'-5' exonuclease PolX [Actinobacteria bacterium]|nr:MAG: DNA polymerase/3'-5' exonuclease PolX [Actinomycetota bacterium]
MTNKEVAQILYEIAEILEILGEIPFKIGAYQKAGGVIESMAEDINELASGGPSKLKKLPGVGAHLADRIYQLVTTGHMDYYEEIKKKVPSGLVDLIRVPGLGPKKAKLIYDELGITSIEDVEAAAKEHKIRDLKGMGAKTEENILDSIAQYYKHHERIMLADAYPIAISVIEKLKEQAFVKKADLAGSLRRFKSTIGDIDILATGETEKIMDYFCTMPEVNRVLAKGKTKSAIIHHSGLEIDLRVVKENEYGAALQYFTGSKEHSVALRGIAKKAGLKLSEYGVFEADTDKKVAGITEEEVYKTLGMPYIIPQLRENKGEIEAALENRLPQVIEQSDIRGDLHVHTKDSHGANSLEEMVIKAIELGYEYIAINDHGEKLHIAGGLSAKELLGQVDRIKELNEKYKEITILSSCETNIDNDGNIDYEDDVLAALDMVSASIHGGFGQSKEQITKRMIKAIENPYVKMICHPTGAVLNKRSPYQLDLEAIFDAAYNNNTVLELNSFPNRLDLNDDYLKRAKEIGVKIAINTDAHTTGQMDYMFYGVVTAQRGWLERDDVVNCWPLDQVLNYFA